MNANKYLLIPLAAVAVMLAGCGKPQPDASSPPADPGTPTVTETQDPAPPAPELGTNEPATAAGQFANKSQASPFASADMALRETYDRALIANQIGDYPRALAELQDLAANTTLNPRQQQAVQDLLAQIKKAAPDLVATNAPLASAAIKPEPPAEFPLASATATESTKNAADFAFSTADPSVRESFARAKAAFDIGDYPKALDELTDLSTNAQLNSQQKYAVQVLLGKTPQSLPAVTTPANPPPSPKP